MKRAAGAGLLVIASVTACFAQTPPRDGSPFRLFAERGLCREVFLTGMPVGPEAESRPPGRRESVSDTSASRAGDRGQPLSRESPADTSATPDADSRSPGNRKSGPDTSSALERDTKSPGLAMLLSALVPGAGQFYNESYWKVPVVAGLGAYFVAEWLHNNRLAADYRDRYAASVASGNDDEDLRSLREFYKDQRDSFAWYFVILYAAAILDAYVDASLYGFDVSPDLSAHRVLPWGPAFPSVRFSLRF